MKRLAGLTINDTFKANRESFDKDMKEAGESLRGTVVATRDGVDISGEWLAGRVQQSQQSQQSHLSQHNLPLPASAVAAALDGGDTKTTTPIELLSHVVRGIMVHVKQALPDVNWDDNLAASGVVAVVGHPANFSMPRVSAMKHAAELGGVPKDALQFADEPVLAFLGALRCTPGCELRTAVDELLEQQKGDEDAQYVLVYDVGGGTTDLSILSVRRGLIGGSRRRLHLSVVDSGGLYDLAGKNFKSVLRELFAEQSAEVPEDKLEGLLAKLSTDTEVRARACLLCALREACSYTCVRVPCVCPFLCHTLSLCALYVPCVRVSTGPLYHALLCSLPCALRPTLI